MLIFNNLGEMQPYYDKDTNTYEFMKDGKKASIVLYFDLNIKSSISARDIKARDIKAVNIKAVNINAGNINAWDIKFYAVCCAYKNIKCKSIKGERANYKYFCLDGEVIIEPEE